MTVFVTMYVGCIECGVPTEVVGVYATAGEALAARRAVLAGGDSWARHGGQGFVTVFGPVVGGETRDPSGEAWPRVETEGDDG